MTDPIKVFVLDDHELVRRGLVDLLNTTHDITVVGEAATVAQALQRIPAVKPDVAILDWRLPDGTGIEVCQQLGLNHPKIRCLMLTSYDHDEALFEALMAGAAGYLLKEIDGGSLVGAIRQIAQGNSLMDPALTSRVLARLRSPVEGDPRVRGLNARDLQILELITEGLTNRRIGVRLSLAEATVKNYVSALLTKLNVDTRTQAAVVGATLTSRPSSTADRV